MKAVLLVFKNHFCAYTLYITEDQRKRILSLVDYTPEQYKVLSEITGLSKEYFSQEDVDYCIEW